MCLKCRKSKTSEILRISRNKCTLKKGCVLLSLQVARCLSSGEQRHNHPLDYHHHRHHISIEEDLKLSNLTVFSQSNIMPLLNIATVITSITINSSSDRVLHLKPIVSNLITDLLAFFRNLDAIVDLAKDKVALS